MSFCSQGGLSPCMLGYHTSLREQTPHPPDQALPEAGTPLGAVHAGRYGQQAGGMHPTGMQSYVQMFFCKIDCLPVGLTVNRHVEESRHIFGFWSVMVLYNDTSVTTQPELNTSDSDDINDLTNQMDQFDVMMLLQCIIFLHRNSR